MRIAAVGAGYVGLTLAAVLAPRHQVAICDIDKSKVQAVNARRSPFHDATLGDFLRDAKLDLTATESLADACLGAEVVILAAPTNYDAASGCFYTSTLEAVLGGAIEVAPEAVIVIKSTVPVGFTKRMRAGHPGAQIVFAPEFLR